MRYEQHRFVHKMNNLTDSYEFVLFVTPYCCTMYTVKKQRVVRSLLRRPYPLKILCFFFR
jgi:hypothetical protein